MNSYLAKTTAAKKLQNLKNEFVKINRVLQETIKHINVKFELLCRLNREAATDGNASGCSRLIS